jgi:pSer/pThr/pTyr-binding forkhead associated (FHA) protein
MSQVPENEREAHANGKLPSPVQLYVRVEVEGKPPREFNYDFQQDVISFGRDPENDIQVPLTTVSREHARIFHEHGDYFLEDLNSTHGTKHNDRKLGPREKKILRDGDKINIMSFSVEFRTTNAYSLERQPGEKTEHMARRMVQEIISSVSGTEIEPTTIRIMNGGNEGTRYEFKESQTEVVMGRSPDCDVIIDDHNASRRHCLIKRTWNGFTAQDLGSKNGVILNDVNIEGAVYLKDSDEIQIGGVKLLFIDPASRILNQFGGVGEETAMDSDISPIKTDEQAEVAEEEEYEESSEEQSYEEEEVSESESQEFEDDGPSGPMESFEGEDDPDDEDKEEEIELPAVSNSSAKAEIIMLILGLSIFFGAVALFVFLKL